MEVTLLPVATSKIVLIPTTTTLPLENGSTRVKVIDHLASKYAAQRAIMLIVVTKSMLGLT